MSDNKGLKYDNAKPDMSLIPAAAALEEAAVWTYGKQKYDAFNWHKGLKYNRILSSIERHLTLLKAGQDYDYENGLHNAAAIRCCCAMLIQFTLEERSDLDDRLALSKATSAAITEMAKGNSIFQVLEATPAPAMDFSKQETAINAFGQAYAKLSARYTDHDHASSVAQDANETAMSTALMQAAGQGYKIP